MSETISPEVKSAAEEMFAEWQDVKDRAVEIGVEEKALVENVASLLGAKKTTVRKAFTAQRKIAAGEEIDTGEVDELRGGLFGYDS